MQSQLYSCAQTLSPLTRTGHQAADGNISCFQQRFPGAIVWREVGDGSDSQLISLHTIRRHVTTASVSVICPQEAVCKTFLLQKQKCGEIAKPPISRAEGSIRLYFHTVSEFFILLVLHRTTAGL